MFEPDKSMDCLPQRKINSEEFSNENFVDSFGSQKRADYLEEDSKETLTNLLNTRLSKSTIKKNNQTLQILTNYHSDNLELPIIKDNSLGKIYSIGINKNNSDEQIIGESILEDEIDIEAIPNERENLIRFNLEDHENKKIQVTKFPMNEKNKFLNEKKDSSKSINIIKRNVFSNQISDTFSMNKNIENPLKSNAMPKISESQISNIHKPTHK